MQAKAQLEEQIKTETQTPIADPDPRETSEWLEAWDQILEEQDPQRAAFLLEALTKRARMSGLNIAPKFNTPYTNTILVEDQVPYPLVSNLQGSAKGKNIRGTSMLGTSFV